jgi:CRISPR/Cas system-associated protein Cas7 (RAMP superfamily)
MLHYKIKNSTSLSVNNYIEGETIEEKIRRITETKEPISDGAEIIYTPRKDGVKPEYDIRTDRFDVAIDAMDKVSKTRIARREESLKAEIDGVEPIQGTDD